MQASERVSMSGSKVRVVVVGVGHFGRYHVQKLSALDSAELVAIADIDPAVRAAAGQEFGCRAVADYRELLSQVDAAIIAVPTLQHHTVAKDFLESGAHVLVEKPIAHTVAEAEDLVSLARDQRRVLQVGHLVRFSGAAQALRQHLVRPLYVESIRIAPFKPRSMDINVVLDLMIHDLDLIMAFVESPLESVDAAGAPVVSASEDIANARLKFTNGCIANITASRISLKTERRMRVFQRDCYLTVDFDAHSIRKVALAGPRPVEAMPKVVTTTESFADADPLRQSIGAFLQSIVEGTPPLVSGHDGVRALDAAVRVTESLRAHAALIAAAGESLR